MIQPKAILFDMDGVLLDSERLWRKYEQEFWDVLKIELSEELKELIYGISVPEEYKIMKKEFDLQMTLPEYQQHYDNYAQKVYSHATLAENLNEILKELRNRELLLGIVSNSLGSWIDISLKRIENPDFFNQHLSIADAHFMPKPSPQGYLHMAKLLGVNPAECIVVEDSNRGIKSGKNAGIYTIATSEFVDQDYEQIGYDTRIGSLKELSRLFNQ